MLVPKRVKHRREFRGKMRGEAKGGKEVAFGEFGLQATTSHWITNRQIEAARIAMTFTTHSIQATVDNIKSMQHGIAFELMLPELISLPNPERT